MLGTSNSPKSEGLRCILDKSTLRHVIVYTQTLVLVELIFLCLCAIIRRYVGVSAFTLKGFDDQERNLMFVKMDFQVLKLKFHACNFKKTFYLSHTLTA